MSPIPIKEPHERARDNERTHVLFATGDPAAPAQIKDRNGEVVLGLCIRCGAAEGELAEKPCIERMMARAADAFGKLSPLEKAIEFARQRRSWVVGEMQLRDDDTVDPNMSREKAMALYEQIPEGALLAELERRMAASKPEQHDPGHPHLIKGEFQSDKYPATPRGKVPLSVKDRAAQDLLWTYAGRRRPIDSEFCDDLRIALLNAGYSGQAEDVPLAPERRQGDRRKAHYGDGIQPWDVILANGWGPQFAASNVLKYLRRTKNPAHSAESAVWYYARLVEGAAEGLGPNPREEWQAVLDRLELSLTTEEIKKARGG